MFLVMHGDHPLVLTNTLADAEELAATFELAGQHERFCTLMLCHSLSANWAMKIIKGQNWQYHIHKLEVI